MKISIIIPSYNRAKYISDTLTSVVNQSSSAWECFIIDDGSTDGTHEVVRKFIGKYPQMPFSFMDNQRSKGAQGARNTGIINSTGEYLIFLDSDDILDVHCVENRLKVAMQYPDCDYFAFPVRLFNETPGDSQLVWNRMHKEGWDILDRFLVHDAPWQTLGCLWSRKAILDIGMWDERVTSLQDWDAHIQAVMHPDLKGWLSYDEKAFDAFYRVGSYDSVSKKFASRKGAETNIYLVEKTCRTLKDNGQLDNHLPSFRRLLWIMGTLISIADNDLGKLFFDKFGFYYQTRDIRKQAYRFYIENRFNKNKSKILRGIASCVPKFLPLSDISEREDTCTKLKIEDL